MEEEKTKTEKNCDECSGPLNGKRNLYEPDKVLCAQCHMRIRNYNLRYNDYNYILNKQRGVCAICKNKHKNEKHKLVIDHCHRTGMVRGLLCGKCNTGIGMLMDDDDVLWSAIMYLKKAGVRIKQVAYEKEKNFVPTPQYGLPLTEEERDEIMSRISYTTSYKDTLPEKTPGKTYFQRIAESMDEVMKRSE